MTATSFSAVLQRSTLHILLAVISLVTLFPLLWMVTSAFTPNELILQKALRLWPEEFTLSNFTIAVSDLDVAVKFFHDLCSDYHR
jgi:ABC-type glycerol-3-phosphate transport system permease component